MANPGGFTVWLTGMLGAGKTTLAEYVAARLRQVGRNVEILDEETLAAVMWKEVGDTKEDRLTIGRRIGFVGGETPPGDGRKWWQRLFGE